MAKKQRKPKRKEKRKAAGVSVGLTTKKPTPKSRYSQYVANILNKTEPRAFDLFAGGSMAEFLMEPDAQMERMLPVGIYLDIDNDSDVSLAFEIWGKAFEREGFEIVAGSIIRGSAFITLFARYKPIHPYNIHKKVSDVVDFATKKLPDKLKKTALVFVGASAIVMFSVDGTPVKQPVDNASGQQTWEAIHEKVKQAAETGEKQGNRVLDILEMLAILKAKSALKTGPVLGKDGPFPMIEGFNPEIMKFTTLYQGPGGPRTPIHAVVHSKNHLESILPNPLALGIDPNQIDFENEEVIIVGLGQRPSSGYKIEIKSVVYCTDRGGTLPPLTLVNYSEETPSGIAEDVLTFPAHVIKLKKLAGAIQFNKT